MTLAQEAQAVFKYAQEREAPPRWHEVGKRYKYYPHGEETDEMVTCIGMELIQFAAFKAWKVTFRRDDGSIVYGQYNTYPDKPSYDSILQIIRNAANPKEQDQSN